MMRLLGLIGFLLAVAAMVGGVVLDAMVTTGGWRYMDRDIAGSGHLIATLGAVLALGGIVLIAAGGVAAAVRRAAVRQVEVLTEMGGSYFPSHSAPPPRVVPPPPPVELRMQPAEEPAPVRQIVPTRPPPETDGLAVGGRVTHAKHGLGVLTSLGDRSARVTFDRGGSRVVPRAELALPVATR